jgi:hypothetical protein
MKPMLEIPAPKALESLDIFESVALQHFQKYLGVNLSAKRCKCLKSFVQ